MCVCTAFERKYHAGAAGSSQNEPWNERLKPQKDAFFFSNSNACAYEDFGSFSNKLTVDCAWDSPWVLDDTQPSYGVLHKQRQYCVWFCWRNKTMCCLEKMHFLLRHTHHWNYGPFYKLNKNKKCKRIEFLFICHLSGVLIASLNRDIVWYFFFCVSALKSVPFSVNRTMSLSFFNVGIARRIVYENEQGSHHQKRIQQISMFASFSLNSIGVFFSSIASHKVSSIHIISLQRTKKKRCMFDMWRKSSLFAIVISTSIVLTIANAILSKGKKSATF